METAADVQLLDNPLVPANHSFFASRTYQSLTGNGIVTVNIKDLSDFIVYPHRS